jgi:glycoside hydrolase-like protein
MTLAPASFSLHGALRARRLAHLPRASRGSGRGVHFISFSARIAALLLIVLLIAAPAPAPKAAASRSYLGFDRNIYPGDDALPILRKTFAYTSYWLSPPPRENSNSWSGKRELLRSLGFGFLVLYRGPQSSELQSTWSESRFNRSDRFKAQAGKRGTGDASLAAAAAKKEGFPSHTVIFLDIEEGGRLPEVYHVYLRAWVDQLERANYRAGVYCSGMPFSEGSGTSIITVDDIRNNIGSRDLVYWVYNDACPPSPGCVFPQTPPSPAASGISYAAVWQFAQSPRRREFTWQCAATYHADGHCYAPGDTAHRWFLDINSAFTPDPSRGSK